MQLQPSIHFQMFILRNKFLALTAKVLNESTVVNIILIYSFYILQTCGMHKVIIDIVANITIRRLPVNVISKWMITA